MCLRLKHYWFGNLKIREVVLRKIWIHLSNNIEVNVEPSQNNISFYNIFNNTYNQYYAWIIYQIINMFNHSSYE